MSELRGRYPGGPSRNPSDDDALQPRPRRELPTVEEIEARAAAGSQLFRFRRRRRRVAFGLALSVLLSAVVGIWLGWQSHRTDQELARELRKQAVEADFDLNREADRLINEIWKTEALEKRPRQP